MKALSVREPWISLIAEGRKTIEVRTWHTSHRDEVLLVGSKRIVGPYAGLACCLAVIADCRPMRKRDEQKSLTVFVPDTWAWELADVQLIHPFAVRGKMGLFEFKRPTLIMIPRRQPLMPVSHKHNP